MRAGLPPRSKIRLVGLVGRQPQEVRDVELGEEILLRHLGEARLVRRVELPPSVGRIAGRRAAAPPGATAGGDPKSTIQTPLW